MVEANSGLLSSGVTLSKCLKLIVNVWLVVVSMKKSFDMVVMEDMISAKVAATAIASFRQQLLTNCDYH